MKTLESTKIWILLCSIIVSSVATKYASSPDYSSTSPRKKTPNSSVPTAVQMPEKVMSNREVSCISADSNIFEIMNEAKKSCRGNDMTCTFYIFDNLKYNNIGSLDINKSQFDNLLMKYDNWLLTTEKIAEKDSLIYTKRDEKYREQQKEHTSAQSDSFAFAEEKNLNIDTFNSGNEATNTDFNSNEERTLHSKHRSRAHNTENGDKHINVKEKSGKYIELLPKYDKKRKYFEVFLPEDKRRGKSRTIHVNINDENEHPSDLQKEIDTISNVPITDELQEDSKLGNYDVPENRKVGYETDPFSTNIREYNTEYLNENSYRHQRDPEHKKINKIKPFKETEGGETNSLIKNVIPTDSYLGQSQEINNYIDKNNSNIQNDTWIVDTNIGGIASGNAQESLTHNFNIDSSGKGINSNSNLEFIADTTENKVSPKDTSNNDTTSSTNANHRDLNHTSNNALEKIRSQYNDNFRTLVPKDRSQTIISSDITENMYSNTENSSNDNINGPENTHEKHNLTPLHNKTKHMHDLVDQATLNDDFLSHTSEYTNIYNEHDFDDTHLSVHDNSTLKTSNIHLNEPVFLTVDSFRENRHETSPFVVTVPKYNHDDHSKVSDYIGTQIDITAPKNKSHVSDISPKTSLSHLTTSILENVVPKTVLPDTIINSEPNFMLPSFTAPEDMATPTNTLVNADLDSLSIIPDATLTSFVPYTEAEDSSILELTTDFSKNEISLNAVSNSLSIAEANSVLDPNEAAVFIDESSILNNLNVLGSTLSINDDTSSQIELDELPELDWHIEDSSPYVTAPLSPKPNLKLQQPPQFSSKSTESSFDFIPGTSLLEMTSDKPIYRGQKNPLLTRLDSSFVEQPYIEPDISDQFQTPTSISTTNGSKMKTLLASETVPYLDDNSKSVEPNSFIPPEFTSLIAENDLLESAFLSPSIGHDQPMRVNKISQHKSPSATNILSDVGLQNHLSTEEINNLNTGDLKQEQVEPLLGPASLLKAKKPTHILNNIPSKHNPFTSHSSPLNYLSLTEADMTDLPPLRYSGIPIPKYTTPLSNKDCLAIPSLQPLYSKIPHTPTSTIQPLLKTKLSQKAPLVLDNDSVLTALHDFAKSTKANPLIDEDFQRLINELPSDLNNLLLSESSPVDSELKFLTTDSNILSINKISQHKTKPTVDQYTHINEIAQSSEELLSLPSTPFTRSELQKMTPKTVNLTPKYIKPITLEQFSNVERDSSEIIPELDLDSSSTLHSSMLKEYFEINSEPTDSYTYTGTSSSVPTSLNQDLSLVPESTATSPHFYIENIPIETGPVLVQPNELPNVENILGVTSQMDTALTKTLPLSIFEPFFESPLKPSDISIYEKSVPSLSLDSKSLQFYEDSSSSLKKIISETQTDNLLYNPKTIHFYEERGPSLNNVILETLNPDITETTIQLTPVTSKPSPATSSVVPEDLTLSTYTSNMDSTLLSSVKPISTSTPTLLSLLDNHNPRQFSTETVINYLKPSDNLNNLHNGPKSILLNHLKLPISKLTPGLSVSTSETLTPQNSLQQHITPHYTTILPSNISPTDTNQYELSSASFIQSDNSPSVPIIPTLANISPLLEQNLQTQRPIQLQSSSILPSASITHIDQLDLLKSSFASTTLDADSSVIPSYEPSFECIPKPPGHPSKSIPKIPFSPFNTPFTYSPVFNKSMPTVSHNDLLVTPNNFAHQDLHPQILSEISQPLINAESELKKELSSIIRPIEMADLQQSNLFQPSPVSSKDSFSHLDIPSQKVAQASLTLPDQSLEFLTALEQTIDDQIDQKPCIEPYSKPLPSTYTFIKEDISKNIPITPFKPTSSSSYVPITSLSISNWQAPSIKNNLQASEPALYIDSHVANADYSTVPCNPVLEPLLDITSENGIEPELLDSYIHLPSTSVFTSSHSSIIQPLQYIPQLAKSNVLPKLIPTKYCPKYFNDIKPLLDENISHLLNDMSILPFTQPSEAFISTTRDKTICEDEIVYPQQLPISSIINTASKPTTIATSSLKDSDISLINYIPLQKPFLTPALSPISQNHLSELSLPVDHVLPYEDVSLGLSNINACLSESEISLYSPSRPLDSNLLPNIVSQLEYKPIIIEDIAQNIPPQLLSDVSETHSQDYSTSVEKILGSKLMPTRPVLPLPTPSPSSPYLYPLYSCNYPHLPYHSRHSIDLKILKDSLKLSPIPVSSRPIGAKFSQPIIEESFCSTASSKLPPTTSYTDTKIAKLKPQIISKPAIFGPLQSPFYSSILPTDTLTTSTMSVMTPQLNVPQYNTNPLSYIKPLDLQNYIPMNLQSIQPIQNIIETIESISKPKLDTNSKFSSIPCLASPANVLPVDINLPMIPITHEYSVQHPTLLSPTQSKPNQKKLSSLQSHLSLSSPIYVESEYNTPTLPKTSMRPLKAYPSPPPTYGKSISQEKFIPIPIQPKCSKKLFSEYALPLYTTSNIPLTVHPIIPSQVSTKPMSTANSFPLLPANGFPADFTTLSSSYTTMSPYSSVSVYPKPIPSAPCKLSVLPSNIYLPEHLTPASFVETALWSPSSKDKLIQPSASPSLSIISQYSTSADILRPLSPTSTKQIIPAHTTTPIIPSSSSSHMTPQSQKPIEYLSPEHNFPISLTNTYPSISYSSTTPSQTRPYKNLVSYIDSLLPMDLHSQAKKPLSKSPKSTLNIPWEGTKSFVNEIQNIPIAPNMNTMNIPTYRPPVSNLQINQNDLENNMVDAVKVPSAETLVSESLISVIPQQSSSDTTVFTDAIGVSKNIGKESKIEPSLESLSNILELDETTEMLLNEVLSPRGPMPYISGSIVGNIPLSETIHNKPEPANILKLDEGTDVLLNEDLLQGEYLPYPPVQTLPTRLKMEATMYKWPHLTPLQSYTPSNVAPQTLSSNFAAIHSSPTLLLPLSYKSLVIPSPSASVITPLPETDYSLMQQYPYKLLPLQKQPPPPMLSLPYSLVPITELRKLLPEQSTSQYTSTSEDLRRIVDIIFSQQTPPSQIPTILHSSVASQAHIAPFSKAASPTIPLELYEASPPTYIKPTYSIHWKQTWPTQPISTAITKCEAPITTCSAKQDASLPQINTNIQSLTPVDDLSQITFSNETPAIVTAIESLSNVTPTKLASSSSLDELENSVTTSVNIKPSNALNANLQILQNNKLFPLGNIPKYSSPIEIAPQTSSRPWSTLLPSDFKMNTQNLYNQFKTPSTTQLSVQPEEVAEFYETAKPHPKLIPKIIQNQLNAPISSPLTSIEPETIELYKSFKPHPKLLASLDQYAISQSTADSSSVPDTVTPLDTLPEPYIPRIPKSVPSVPVDGIPNSSSPLLRPLMNTNFKTRPEIFYKIPKKMASMEGILGNAPANSVEITQDQLYSSPLKKPMYSKKSSLISPNYMEYMPQSPLPILDGQSVAKDLLLNSQLLKPLHTSSQSVPPNILKYLAINPYNQSPLISNDEYCTPSPIEIESLVTETSNIIAPRSTSSIPNTLQNSPLKNNYQSLISMLPSDSQDIIQKSQLSSIIGNPLKNIYSTATPLSKPSSSTAPDTEFSKSPYSQFISPTYTPLIKVLDDSSRLKTMESYNTFTSRWKSGLPNATPIPNTLNLLPNKYPSNLQYKIPESLPTPVTDAQHLEILNYKKTTTPYPSSSTTPSLTSSALTSLDAAINEFTEPRTRVSELKSSYIPVTYILPQLKEVSQTLSGYSNLNDFSAPSSVTIQSKLIESPDLHWIYSPTPISAVPIYQSNSQALPPNILQYLPLNYGEAQLVSPMIDRQNITVSPIPNTAFSFSSLPTNGLQSPIISKFAQLYETPSKQELITPNIVTSNIRTPKEMNNIQGGVKYTLTEEPIELNSVKTFKSITTNAPTIKYKDLDQMEITHMAEFSPDIPNTKPLIKTQSTVPEKTGPEPEISYEIYQNVVSEKLLKNQMHGIPQYLPLNKISPIATYCSPTNYYTKSNKTAKLAKPDISKVPLKYPLTPTSMNPESISEYTNFYSNNYIGNIPKLFKIPTTINNDTPLPINSVSPEIYNEFTSNTIEYVDSTPKLETTPLKLNEFKTITPVETPYHIYNTENMLTPCSKSNPKSSSYTSPMAICETPIRPTEIPCQPIPFTPDSTIKYQGYKTYYPTTNILQSSTKSSETFSPLQYQNQILNTTIKPCQAKLELDDIHQRLKLDNYDTVEGVHDHKDIDKELKSIILNYINSKNEFKNHLFNNNGELVIPLGDLAINKKESSDYKTIGTNNPSIGLKVWKSNAKIVTAELKLKFKELSVTNFMPVINNLNEFDVEEICKIVKEYIDQKYGNHIEIHEPYTADHQYIVLKDVDQNAFNNKFNLLWPTEYV